ncbi:MAG: thiamine diphosphokinase [candidate division Zixibacteria bacterium]|nr:thiamine diphosphokinase [candidate division Zixibacteria bacterium]
MKTKAAIYLNGSYPPDHLYFYIRECKNLADNSFIIVTDGGLQFFINNNLSPDLILGDWDSTDIRLIKSFPKALTISMPGDGKALTDGEMALDWCMNNNITDIVIYGGIDTTFETDQLLGNIFMMFAYKNKFSSTRMRDYCQEIIPLENETFSSHGRPGEMLSVVPVSDEIKYEAKGLKYNPKGQTFKFGQTMPLRNELAASRFSVKVTGRAVLIRHFY